MSINTKQAYRSILGSITGTISAVGDSVTALSKYSQFLDNRAELDLKTQEIRHKVKLATYEDDHIEEIMVEKFKRRKELEKMLNKSGDEKLYEEMKSQLLQKING